MSENSRKYFYFCSVIIVIFLYGFVLHARTGGKTKLFGKVTDKSSREPIPYVNVFLNSTTMGAATDLNGKFEIDDVPDGSFILIVSHIGYKLKSKSVNVYQSSSVELNIELEPKILQTKEINVTASNPEEWHDQLKVFKREFIGDGDFSEECKILNPEVINFKSGPDSGELTASSDSVLRIENDAMGYRLDIILNKFDFNTGRNRIQYIVYPRFHTMKPKSKADSVRWAENRLDSYSGSFRNFISAVYNSKVEEEGFSLFSGEFQALVDGYGKYVSPDKLIVISEVSSSLKRFYIDKCYKIKYREYLKSFSIMCPVKNYALIDRWGNVVNPIAVETAGDWTRDRISNLLPDNYEPGGTK